MIISYEGQDYPVSGPYELSGRGLGYVITAVKQPTWVNRIVLLDGVPHKVIGMEHPPANIDHPVEIGLFLRKVENMPKQELQSGAFRVYDREKGEYDKWNDFHTPEEGGLVAPRFCDETERFTKEEWAHRYDSTGTPLYENDKVLVSEAVTGTISWFENLLQWMITFDPDHDYPFFIPLTDYDCDENGVIAEIQIIGNIHAELKKAGL